MVDVNGGMTGVDDVRCFISIGVLGCTVGWLLWCRLAVGLLLRGWWLVAGLGLVDRLGRGIGGFGRGI